MLTIDKVYDAARVLESVVRHTQLIEAPKMSASLGCKLYLKPENLQVTGSFKVRGSAYKISQLTPEEKASVSHRGKALEIFDVKLREYLKEKN